MNDVQLTFQDPLEESPLSSYFLVPLIWRIMEGKDSQTRGREVLILLSLPFPNTQISPYWYMTWFVDLFYNKVGICYMFSLFEAIWDFAYCFQPLTNFETKKCKRCGFYEKDRLVSDDKFDEWEFCPSDFTSHGKYVRNKEKEFKATFLCPECLHIGSGE